MCCETGVGVSAVAYPPPLLHEAGLVSTGLWWTLSCRWLFVYVWMSGDLCVYFRPFLLYYYYLFGYLIVFLPLFSFGLGVILLYFSICRSHRVCFGPDWCILGFLSSYAYALLFLFLFLFSTFYFLSFISFSFCFWKTFGFDSNPLWRLTWWVSDLNWPWYNHASQYGICFTYLFHLSFRFWKGSASVCLLCGSFENTWMILIFYPWFGCSRSKVGRGSHSIAKKSIHGILFAGLFSSL